MTGPTYQVKFLTH